MYAIRSYYGYNIGNWQELQSEIIKRAPLYPSKFILTDEYGNKYEQKIILYGEKDNPCNVVVGWRSENEKTWMASCYIKEVD